MTGLANINAGILEKFNNDALTKVLAALYDEMIKEKFIVIPNIEGESAEDRRDREDGTKIDFVDRNAKKFGSSFSRAIANRLAANVEQTEFSAGHSLREFSREHNNKALKGLDEKINGKKIGGRRVQSKPSEAFQMISEADIDALFDKAVADAVKAPVAVQSAEPTAAEKVAERRSGFGIVGRPLC